MLIDDIEIRVEAGRGGDGAVAFNKNLMSLGPTGASGGQGGSVYLEGVSDIGALTRLRHTKVFKARDGGTGGRQYNDGKDGEDLTIQVPIGTVIHFADSPAHDEPVSSGRGELEITQIGQRIIIAKGGRGGKGNFHFRSSTNTSPQQSQPGKPGEQFSIRLELKLIADVGLVGLPNAGKSSLLNELTKAKSKVANYAFTTLEPNLGAYYDLIIADIPGIIEGAAEGKGLGIKFLKHIERTKILFHLISSESENPAADYEIIKKELFRYSPGLAKKEERLFVSKSDMVSTDKIQEILSVLKKKNPDVSAVSIHDADSLERVKEILNKIGREKIAPR
ncbi:MAG: hypothetical protein A3J46_00160 [Candidatus Yanofskybacteria bacterium RIFCSPHIGHO2_02_FULL_41_11]|uniref:GTPase Obg n=1 Tax=Candidatus Yanofskybacteria bacterium RIFCSPHIGHO2_02_FULL_41_11 TaxID=1802675 RepID=A0A1F8F7A5_9BACT|nr:MAG: GTPase obg [Microgenomates group bacterium GW2011_GWA1_Microgenomates_45_10]OGN09023.1 MAG: hypothetical protein A3J46_00160 [Candidatus Yanofskybacteria bacterium RIFCSPHIGHO2_02_FULL_41_11]